MENGFNVSMPLLDASPYDCLLEKEGRVFKIQIKYVSADRQKDEKYNNMRVSLHIGPNTPNTCLLYTSPSPRDRTRSRMPSSA